MITGSAFGVLPHHGQWQGDQAAKSSGSTFTLGSLVPEDSSFREVGPSYESDI